MIPFELNNSSKLGSKIVSLLMSWSYWAIVWSIITTLKQWFAMGLLLFGVFFFWCHWLFSSVPH